MKDKLEKIINHYGYNHQKIKLVEECSELIRAIATEDDQNMLEEMADVSVLIDEITYHFPLVREEFEKIRLFKVNRTIERFENVRSNWQV